MPTRKKRQGPVRGQTGDDASSPSANPPSITGAAFWALMDRWQVPDEAALDVIAGPSLTKTGKRPRFRLTGEQVERFTLLRQIDRHAADVFGSAAKWLARAGTAAFAGRTPLAAHSASRRCCGFSKCRSFKASVTRQNRRCSVLAHRTRRADVVG
jgi:hypothetical protein